MRFLPLLLANFKRHKLRTVLTVLSIVVAFILFGYLSAVRRAFQLRTGVGVELPGNNRLLVRERVSIINLLPARYEAMIEQIDGVVAATHSTPFLGIYRHPKNYFAQFAVDPHEFLAMFPEFILPADQKQAWLKTRTGAVVGRGTAERFGFKIGDRIPLQATIWIPKDAGKTWYFDLVGIYDGAAGDTDISNFFFRKDYHYENALFGQGSVGWYHVRIKDARQAAEVGKRIDERFENSRTETRTESEGAFLRAIADQIGNVGIMVKMILAVVFFTMLLVAGNTMGQAVHERVSELAVMKAIGFTDRLLLTFVLSESLLIAIIGGGVGLTLGWLAVSARNPIRGLLPAFTFAPNDIAAGVAYVVLLGAAAGLLPAIAAMRLNTVDALKRE